MNRIVVLAGGRATRLGPLSADTPKFLVPLSATKRFADVQLAWLKRHGFEDVILSVGHLAQQVAEYCGDGSRYGLRLTYAEDGATPLGTGGAVKKALQGLHGSSCVMYGDTILEFDVAEAVRRGGHALMTVLRCPPPHVPNAQLQGTHVLYDKKQPKPEWTHIDYGFLILSETFVREMKSEPHDLAEPLAAASRAGKLLGLEAFEPFWEINTPDALEAFKRRFA